jgi:hypothetical protein
MAVDPSIKDFWISKSKSPTSRPMHLHESIDSFVEYSRINRVLSLYTPTNKLADENTTVRDLTLSLADFLKLKKENALSESVARVVPDEDGHQNVTAVPMFDDEDNAILSQVSNEVAKKYLELYFDAYMAPLHSDIKWRLGPVSGVYVPSNDIKDETGLLTDDGKLYTRSNMFLPFDYDMYCGGEIREAKRYYANLFFPPYKIGAGRDIESRTNLMRRIYRENPNATFDQDRFAIHRLGYTYREAGFKSINDNIMFLQWFAEQCTGIVSTYLTEWDLSVYMQENMIMSMQNGMPSKLWLNFRVTQDNPLATGTLGYNGSKGLCFSVVNSAVSKIDYDCQKFWRPSDFPLSCYWVPYLKDVDYDVVYMEAVEDTSGENVRIPYGSWLDEPCTFDYGGTLKEIIKHQDFTSMAMSQWPDFNIQYFQAFYNTDADALGETDIWQKKMMGAGKTNRCQWMEKGRVEAIANGGINGTMSCGGDMSGGAAAAKAVKKTIKKSTGSPPIPDRIGIGFAGPVISAPMRPNFSSNNTGSGTDVDVASGDEDVNKLQQQTGPGGATASAATILADSTNKVDASIMSKMTGVNRFSPVLYGGPHGGSFSPLTLQAYYDTYNKFLRNTPRLDADTLDGFKNTSPARQFAGVHKWYNNEGGTGISPSKSLSILMNGWNQYTWDYLREMYTKTELVQCKLTWVRGTLKYDFPTTINGQYVSYSGDITYKSVTRFVPINIWGNSAAYRARYWQEYYSYWNDFNIRGPFVWRFGLWGYDTTTFEAYRMGTYKAERVVAYKKYRLHDMPDTRWQIVQHKFNEYTDPADAGSPIWQLVSQFGKIPGWRKIYSGNIKSCKTVFVLDFFGNVNAENEFIDKIIKSSGNQKCMVAFVGQNPGQLGSSYPVKYLFVAECKLEYYKTKYKWSWRHTYVKGSHGSKSTSIWTKILSALGFLSKTTHDHWEERERLVPYIKVDLLGDVPIFYDALDKKGITNKYAGNPEVPLQFDCIPKKNDYIEHDLDILNKFSACCFDVIGSYIDKPTFSNIVRTMSKNTTVSDKPQEGMPLYFPLTIKSEPNAYLSPGYIVRSFNSEVPESGSSKPAEPMDNGKFPDQFSGPTIQEREVVWESTGRMGIQGCGLLSQIQGLDPEVINTKYTNYSQYVKMPVNNVLDTKFKNLAYKTHYYDKMSSSKMIAEDGTEYFVPEGFPTYVSQPMKENLRKALINLVTRSTFYKEDEPELEYFIGLDFQFRIFLNMALYQVSFLKKAKEALLDNVDFEIMRKMLVECVDKCVTKACGLTAEGEIGPKDESSVLYNYWIDVAIQIWGDKTKHIENKQRVSSMWQEKIAKYNAAINVLIPLAKKEIEDWTFRELQEAWNFITALKSELNMSYSDKYIFAYLQILYQYRLFFVGKRFNKEDGTMWVMRALESVIEFIAPTISENNPPPPLSKLAPKEFQFNIAFYELQNTTSMKRASVVHGIKLDEDRIKTIYVKVNWKKKSDYDKWIAYNANPIKNKEVPEVIRIHRHGEVKYAQKPLDTDYTFLSKEMLDNEKNIKWNSFHPTSPQRTVRDDIDIATWPITWGDSPDKTPIRWNIFGSINIDHIIEYSTEGLTPEELLCLAEEGADFWTVHIPENLWPRASGYQNKLKLKHFDPQSKANLIINDPYITILGGQGYSLFPILEVQERPMPGIGSAEQFTSMAKSMSGSY